MKEHPKASNLGTEKYAVYTGAGTPSFIPLVAGITLPNPNYVIYRDHADIYVFEYVLAGKGYVRQGKEQAEARAGDAYVPPLLRRCPGALDQNLAQRRRQLHTASAFRLWPEPSLADSRLWTAAVFLQSL